MMHEQQARVMSKVIYGKVSFSAAASRHGELITTGDACADDAVRMGLFNLSLES